MKPSRVLFLDTYTDPTFKSISSPEIGYGLSCASAVKYGLRELGFPVVECCMPPLARQSKLQWIYQCYDNLNKLAPQKTDVCFLFHSLIHFPGEVRRLVNHHTRVGCPILGYTHGSHWDPTDTIRSASNPGLTFQDLANLLTYDRLLIVSEYYRALLRRQLEPLGSMVLDRFDAIARVVGLPIDTVSLDTMRPQHPKRRSTDAVHVIFNHALRPPKQPELALSVLDTVLAKFDRCVVHMTRAYDASMPTGHLIQTLKVKYPRRFLCHDTLPLRDYYKLLWQCDIQFSTAAHESFGVATVEAMYAENACFTPARLAYPEVTAGIGNYGDLDELLSLIGRAILDFDFRNAIVVSQKRLATRYAPSSIAHNIQSIINGLE